MYHYYLSVLNGDLFDIINLKTFLLRNSRLYWWTFGLISHE